MSRVTYARTYVDPREIQRLEEERRRREEENRRKVIREELERLRRRRDELAGELTRVAARGEALAGEAAGHPAAAAVVETFERRRRGLEALLAGFPQPGADADSSSLSQARSQAQRVLAAATSQLAALENYLPHVEEGVAESRRQSFEARVLAGVVADRAEGGDRAPGERQAGSRGGDAQTARPQAQGRLSGPRPAERPPTAPSGVSGPPSPQPDVQAQVVLARELTRARDLLADLKAALPPEMTEAVARREEAVRSYAAMRHSPSYAAAQLAEETRLLEELSRRAAVRRQERDRLRAEMGANLEELLALRVERSGFADAPELDRVIARGVELAEQPWPAPEEVRAWLSQARSLAGTVRSRLQADATRHLILSEVHEVLEELGYEVLTEPGPTLPAADAPLQQLFVSPHGGGVAVAVARDGSILSEVVRFVEPGQADGETPLESDRLARQTRRWCGDYGTLLERMAQRGLVRLVEQWRNEDEPSEVRAVPAPPELRRKVGSGRIRRRPGLLEAADGEPRSRRTGGCA
ncbi:MAG: hypothetical protein K6U08_00605 [Firmicutes bacterium]|nr:hypothetical protein [Bacillota bacterium]